MPTKEDIEQAIEFCGDLKTVAEGFGVTLGRLKTLMDIYEIKVKNIPEHPQKKDKIVEEEKKKPYIHHTDEHGRRCVYVEGRGNSTAKKCMYGGECAGIDCCDYILIRGHSRPIADKKDPHYCVIYTPIPKEAKKKLRRMKNWEDKRKFIKEYLEKKDERSAEYT